MWSHIPMFFFADEKKRFGITNWAGDEYVAQAFLLR